MVYNAKTFVRSILAQDKFSQVLHLSRLASGKEFTSSFLRTVNLLLDCKDSIAVNPTDRKDIE